MKKQILFVINNLNCGGAEKALISLLETIDYSKYDVDLFLFKHEGLFFNKIPEQVHLLDECREYKYFEMPLLQALKQCLQQGKLQTAFSRLCAGYIFKNGTSGAQSEQRAWKYISKSLRRLDKAYDVAIGYLENKPVYFCIDNVKANKKIGFIHNDYDKLGMDPALDQAYFDKLDHLVTVSEECGHILKKRFPMYEHKVEVMYNIVSPAVINKLSQDKVELKDNAIKLVSVGRLNDQKGFTLAIDSCKKLVQHGYPVQWYVIGEGEERSRLEQMIRENGLQGTFNLLGLKENPYPYIKEADIYVQPSKFEGKSIAIDEAKILHKPIVVTNFSTAKDQINNHENGLIVEMNPKSIFEGIRMLIEDEALRKQFAVNLSKETLGTESEINKLYQLFS